MQNNFLGCYVVWTQFWQSLSLQWSIAAFLQMFKRKITKFERGQSLRDGIHGTWKHKISCLPAVEGVFIAEKPQSAITATILDFWPHKRIGQKSKMEAATADWDPSAIKTPSMACKQACAKSLGSLNRVTSHTSNLQNLAICNILFAWMQMLKPIYITTQCLN